MCKAALGKSPETARQCLQVRFQVLTAASVKMAVFWNVAPCRLVKLTDVSETLMMEAASTSETPTEVQPNYTTQYPRRQPTWGIPSSQIYFVSELCIKQLLF
jgi:hypothetical protein